MDLYYKLLPYIEDTKKLDKLYDIPWNIFYDNNIKYDKNIKYKLKILILNAPCMGFGDIIFAIKFKQYLLDWYNCKVDIATTQPESFIKLGENKIYKLKTKTKDLQCKNFRELKIDNKISIKYDLIFIAPLTADFEPKYKDIKHIIPYSNKFNTFFLSEYNDTIRKNIDFHTGVGKGRYGIFLTHTNIYKKLPQISNRYSIIYIAESIPRAIKCFISFIEMVVKKYNKIYKKFDIIVPEWVSKYCIDNPKKITNIFNKYYSNILVTDKTNKHIISVNNINKSTLTIRGDVLPLSNTDMLRLIKYSVRDILLTGDQSITDAISCCSERKNIFYQIASWKENFGKELSKELKHKYLKYKSTSCGTLKAIKYKSDYKDFVKKWDFRKLGKKKMDSIVLAAINRKRNKKMKIFENIILNSKTLSSFNNRFDYLLGIS